MVWVREFEQDSGFETQDLYFPLSCQLGVTFPSLHASRNRVYKVIIPDKQYTALLRRLSNPSRYKVTGTNKPPSSTPVTPSLKLQLESTLIPSVHSGPHLSV